MNIGMLWLDDDKKRSIDEKVQRAAAYYQTKYGQEPDLCLVNSRTLTSERCVGAIQVRPARNVQPNYFWLGKQQ
jgi:hypothetical protein